MKPLVKQVTRVSVRPEGEPLFSHLNTNIEIDDEAAGQFVVISQVNGHTDDIKRGVAIDRDEWPIIRGAIDEMVERLLPN